MWSPSTNDRQGSTSDEGFQWDARMMAWLECFQEKRSREKLESASAEILFKEFGHKRKEWHGHCERGWEGKDTWEVCPGSWSSESHADERVGWEMAPGAWASVRVNQPWWDQSLWAQLFPLPVKDRSLRKHWRERDTAKSRTGYGACPTPDILPLTGLWCANHRPSSRHCQHLKVIKHHETGLKIKLPCTV